MACRPSWGWSAPRGSSATASGSACTGPTAMSSSWRRRLTEVEPVEVHDLVPDGDEVADEALLAVVARIDLRERLDVGLLLGGVPGPWSERDRDVGAGVACGLLDRRAPAQDDHVRERDGRAEVLPDPLEDLERLPECGGLVGLPVLLRGEAHP